MLGKKIGRVSQTRIKGQKIAVELSIDNSTAIFCPIMRVFETFPIFLPSISTWSPTCKP